MSRWTVGLLRVAQLRGFRRCGWCADELAAVAAVVGVDGVAEFGNVIAADAAAAVDGVDAPDVPPLLRNPLPVARDAVELIAHGDDVHDADVRDVAGISLGEVVDSASNVGDT